MDVMESAKRGAAPNPARARPCDGELAARARDRRSVVPKLALGQTAIVAQPSRCSSRGRAARPSRCGRKPQRGAGRPRPDEARPDARGGGTRPHPRARGGGRHGGALGIYKALWKLLEDEYDVEPSKETQALIADVKMGQGPATPPAPREATASTIGATGGMPRPTASQALSPGALLRHNTPKLVVSIGGFELAGSGATSRHLIEGFRRELIACLVRFREWVVRDRSLVPGQVLSERDDLAEYAIDASAFEAGDTVRFVLTLLDIESNSYLWSEQLDLSVESWFEAQQLVVPAWPARSTCIYLPSGWCNCRAGPQTTSKPRIAWLLGQATFLSFDPKSWDRAADLYRQVIRDMPDFAPAYSSLAQLHNSNHIVMPGIFRDPKRTGRRFSLPARPRVWIPPIRAASCVLDGRMRCRSNTSRP